jgi:uncharacterized protein with von Willebrand factor type A (vWA) domain
MDRLESQLERGSFRPDDVDRSLAQEILGNEARQALDQLRKLTEVLEKAGYVERKGRRMELTPRGMRRIGQSALRDVFDQLKKTAWDSTSCGAVESATTPLTSSRLMSTGIRSCST